MKLRRRAALRPLLTAAHLAVLASLTLPGAAAAEDEHAAHGAAAKPAAASASHAADKADKADKAPDKAPPKSGDKAVTVAKAADKPAPPAAEAGAEKASDKPLEKPLAHLLEKPRIVGGHDEVGLPDLRQRIDERLAQVRAKRLAEAAPVVRVATLAPTAGPAPAAVAAPSAAVATARPRAVAAKPVAPAPVAVPAAAPLPPHWGYEGGEGPAAWAALAPDFSTCASGTRQSPIDIQGGIAVDLEPIRVEYQPSAFRVVDNGHTVQVNVAPGNAITVGGRRYELVEFHFHRPSEERINGRQFDLAAHLVHKDSEGRQAVIAVLMDQGKAHPVVQLVWNNLPLERGEEQAAPGTMDLQALLPEYRGYYTYMGSMTTPPCSEGVLWMVMRQPASLSPEQLAIFAKLHPMNARPVQASNGRLIKQSQ